MEQKVSSLSKSWHYFMLDVKDAKCLPEQYLTIDEIESFGCALTKWKNLWGILENQMLAHLGIM